MKTVRNKRAPRQPRKAWRLWLCSGGWNGSESLVSEHCDALHTRSLRSSKGFRLTKLFKFVDPYKTAKYRRRPLQGLPVRRRPLQVSPTAFQASRLSRQVPLSRLFPSDSPYPVPLLLSSFPAQPHLYRPNYLEVSW